VTALSTNVEARLASNVWAAADSTTNYASLIAFTSITNSYATADATTNYALRTTFVTATNALDNKFTNFLQLAGGTVVGDLRVSRSTTASTALVLTNSGSISTGLRIDLPASSTFLDLNGTNDKYTFTDTTANFHGNTITNAIVAGYLTVTGAAATYVNSTNLPAGIVTTNNLSTIAGSGLGVESNRLVVTNVAGTFEALTGNVASIGNYSITNLVTNGVGGLIVGQWLANFQPAVSISNGSAFFGVANQSLPSSLSKHQINAVGNGSLIVGRYIDNNSPVGEKINTVSGNGSILSGSDISTGPATGRKRIVSGSGSAMFFYSSSAQSNNHVNAGNSSIQLISEVSTFNTVRSISNAGNSSLQLIVTDGATLPTEKVHNKANSSIQTYYLNPAFTSNADSIIESTAWGSILLGPGTQTNAYGILANGPIQSLVGFQGSAAGLTNFPSSILTVSAGNAAYWRITTAPTGATSSGSSGQMAVSGTNLFIYSPNALGVGTARWLRVSGDVSW
jgi:hypothetical protein